jgi:hypothetical protein
VRARHLVVVAGRNVAAACERRARRFPQGDGVQVIRLPAGDDNPVLQDLSVAHECFETVARRLDAIAPGELCDSIALITAPLRVPSKCNGEGRPIDSTFDRGWDPLRSYDAGRDRFYQPSLETVASWLVFTYPEVKWLWWVPGFRSQAKDADGLDQPTRPDDQELREWHGCPVGAFTSTKEVDEERDGMGCYAVARHFPALFDPSGLRASIRSLMGGTAEHSASGSQQICRTKIVLAVDDEREYSQLEGYAAYRSRYRAWVASSWAGFDHLWRWRGAAVPEVHASFEDIYLAFVDQRGTLPQKHGIDPARRRLSYLPYRYAADDSGAQNLFFGSRRRVLVTVGHKHGDGGREIWSENLIYLRHNCESFRLVTKPLGSVHQLLRQAGFPKPPRMKHGPAHSEARHSAPGRVMAACDRLLGRSRRILGDAHTPDDALHAAVLALEAKELLSGRTPTTALEAIALQHEAEVTAESLFLGVEYSKSLRERFQELRREVQAVSYWFGSDRRERSALNARLTISERLAQRFRNLNQIEEELECLAEARRLRFAFWVREKPWRRPLAPFLTYLAFSLNSLPRFAIAMTGWAIFFAVSYCVIGAMAGREPTFWDALTSSLKFSVTGESVSRWTYLSHDDATPLEVFWNGWLAFQGAVSVTNLGLLVSHLYLVVSRR